MFENYREIKKYTGMQVHILGGRKAALKLTPVILIQENAKCVKRQMKFYNTHEGDKKVALSKIWECAILPGSQRKTTTRCHNHDDSVRGT